MDALKKSIRALTDLKVRSLNHLLCIMQIHEQGSCRPSDFKDVGVTSAAVTGILDSLIREKIISREPHPEDRRSNQVKLTPLGSALMQDLEACFS